VSIAEFTVRDRYGREAMRNIASTTEFEFDDEMNTQQHFRKLMNTE
jgi:hypothetical protein